MTLKEIYKIIDEADYVYSKSKKGEERFDCVRYIRRLKKESLESAVKCGYVFTYYKRNEETGEMTLLAKVDHIDKEKKIVKKKLDEMTEEEIDKLIDKHCKTKSNGCRGCPLLLQDENLFVYCADDFMEDKRNYNLFKDEEIEIEVEE